MTTYFDFDSCTPIDETPDRVPSDQPDAYPRLELRLMTLAEAIALESQHAKIAGPGPWCLPHKFQD